jgi:hydrogenase maturation protein HypF
MRVDKPFAVMFPDLATVAAHCRVSEVESALLQSRERPIVILQRKKGRILPLYHPVSPEVTPGQDTIGVMLPYTPFHDLFIEPEAGFPYALVMTSGNISEEPIAIDNAEAKARLNELADVYLLHNRDIRTRCDDSVVRVFEKNIYPMRRSRGYAPFPVKLPVKAMPLLAAGAELKNTFCLTREHYAFLSHHIGDLENYESLCSFEDGVQHLERLFRVTPEAIAFDLHPNYMASRYALERSQRENLPLIGVQHHFAHITACMVDNGLSGEEPLLGVSFDGTGYGTDGAIWGGEFLLTDYAGFQRLKHIAYFPLPGGDAAIREPNRVALSLLDYAGIAWSDNLPPVQEVDHETRHILQRQLKTGINTPKTSSMGRLFDAVSSIAGIRQRVNYEAQAAIELEALVDPEERGIYPFDVQGIEIDPKPMVQKLVADCIAGVPVERIAARFHNGIAQMVVDVCLEIRRDSGIQEIALSGGVWQNMTLLEKVMPLLRESNFTVYLHRQIPTNDGGIALGQAMVAVHHLLGTKS